MPETYFTLRWPDGSEERCYSPSSVITQFLKPGQSYALADFQNRARAALTQASARVEAKYGFACSSAMAQLDQIEARITRFQGIAAAEVACLAISQ
jgi:uncharacterized repeat protein (TIGR04042 family)